MAWKQDLSKLKQQLPKEDAPPPPPKPAPKVDPGRPIEDEDALFLQAMGLKSPARPKDRPRERAEAALQPEAPAEAAPAAEPREAPASFAAALGDLKGLKPMKGNPVLASPKAPANPQPAPKAEAPAPRVEAPAPAPSPAPEPLPEPAPAKAGGAVRIQLAAGMAVEVDGVLDLRGHSLVDALERLKDRLADAAFLGWRTLHVHLGSNPGLQEGFLAFLQSPQAGPVARYAQAPIPMGGAQAWILYLSHPA